MPLGWHAIVGGEPSILLGSVVGSIVWSVAACAPLLAWRRAVGVDATNLRGKCIRLPSACATSASDATSTRAAPNAALVRVG